MSASTGIVVLSSFSLYVAMDIKLYAVRDAYDAAWHDMPFTNVAAIEEMFSAIGDKVLIYAWLAGRLHPSDQAHFSQIAKDR
jgi:hypothetical protein